MTHRRCRPCSLLLSALLLLVPAAPAVACDVDADCGAGGTCIKREKRARGVCYGGSRAGAPETPPAPAIIPGGPAATVPKPVSGVRRERATQMLGDPDQLLKDNLGGATGSGVCMVNQDCPEGLECVIAGFEGRCVKL